MSNMLCQSFGESSIKFSKDYKGLDNQVFNIYREFYDDQFIAEWNELSMEFNEQEVRSAITGLDVNKGAGPMQISVDVIQRNIYIFAPLLVLTFNNILLTGHVPLEWKESYLVPIYKKGDKADINNYRGIALHS